MELLSRAEYARRRNRAKSLITRYVKDGRIVLVDGKVNPEQADKALGFTNENEFEKEKNGESGGDYWKEKTRREAAEASLKELDLARRRGELIEVNIAVHEFSKLADSVRQNLLAIPTKIASVVYGQKTIPATQRVIELAIHEALNEFGTYNAESGKPRASRASRQNRSVGKKAKAPAKTDSERVGK